MWDPDGHKIVKKNEDIGNMTIQKSKMYNNEEPNYIYILIFDKYIRNTYI